MFICTFNEEIRRDFTGIKGNGIGYTVLTVKTKEGFYSTAMYGFWGLELHESFYGVNNTLEGALKIHRRCLSDTKDVIKKYKKKLYKI